VALTSTCHPLVCQLRPAPPHPVVVGTAAQTGSDCEVILPLYLKYGQDCVKHLHGQFAFVVADTRDDSFFIGRDHIGLCPLYWVRQSHRSQRVLSASSLQLLWRGGGEYEPVPAACASRLRKPCV
jgi:asparagine synthetase B (glutamine-hydrolysing)